MWCMFLFKQPCLSRGTCTRRINISLSSGVESVWDAGRLPGVSTASFLSSVCVLAAFLSFKIFLSASCPLPLSLPPSLPH